MKKNKAFFRLLSNPVVIKHHYSPSISRFIPARIPVLNEWAVVVAISAVFLVLILKLSLQINGQIKELAQRQAREQSVREEITYWESVLTKYPDYRDGYFRLALLQYQVDEAEDALISVNHALKIDPRFEPGIAFKEKIIKE